MSGLPLPDPPLSDAVIAPRRYWVAAAPLVRRPECDHLPDVFLARLRGDG